MEEAVWTVFGVISAIIMVGIVVNLVYTQSSSVSLDSYSYVMDVVKNQCDFVCTSPIDTQLSQKIDMFSGGWLGVNENKICLHREDEVLCRFCQCVVKDDDDDGVVLNLTTDLARSSFREHTFECAFRKEAGSLVMLLCKG